jgi:Ca2+-binding RTX toxin-like protein
MKKIIPLLPLLMASAPAATLMISPTAITYSNSPNQEFTGFNLDNENNIINGSGLSATPTVGNVTSVTHDAASSAPPGNAWATIDPGTPGGDFFAEGGSAPVFTIDLGSTYSVTDLVIWGYHFNVNNGNHAKNISLEFSTNGGISYGSPVPLVIPNAVAFNAAELVSFAAQNANYIRMTVTDNFFGVPGGGLGGDRVGIAEVRFMGDAVPEPSSVLLGSLGLFVLLRRMR